MKTIAELRETAFGAWCRKQNPIALANYYVHCLKSGNDSCVWDMLAEAEKIQPTASFEENVALMVQLMLAPIEEQVRV